MTGYVGKLLDELFTPTTGEMLVKNEELCRTTNRAQRRRKPGRYARTKEKCRLMVLKINANENFIGKVKMPRIGGKYLTGFYSMLLDLDKDLQL